MDFPLGNLRFREEDRSDHLLRIYQCLFGTLMIDYSGNYTHAKKVGPNV